MSDQDKEPLFYRNRPVLWGLTMVVLIRVQLVLLLVSVLGFGYLILELNRVKVTQHDLNTVVCQLTQAVVTAFPEEVKRPEIQRLVTEYQCDPLLTPPN